MLNRTFAALILVLLTGCSGSAAVPKGNLGLEPQVRHDASSSSSSFGDITTLLGSFASPAGVAVDSSGNVYVTVLTQSALTKRAPSGAVTTAFRGNDATLPFGVAVDANGNVYFTTGNGYDTSGQGAVFELTSGGVQTTIGTAFDDPEGLAVTASGSAVYVADTSDGSIREIKPPFTGTGRGRLVAGGLRDPSGVAIDSAGNLYAVKGRDIVKISSGKTTMFATGFSFPRGVAVDSSGNVYVADEGANEIVEIETNGTRVTRGSKFDHPSSVAVDASGKLYVADLFGNNVKVIASIGSQSDIATGLSEPTGVAADPNGNVYVAEPQNRRVVKVRNGVQTTVGSFARPVALALDAQHNLYVCDASRNEIVKVTPDGTRSSVGSGLKQPYGVAIDAKGNVYVADRGGGVVKRISPSGKTATIASGFRSPGGIAVGANGDLYVSDSLLGWVEKLSKTSRTIVTTGLRAPAGLAIDGKGRLYIADPGDNAVLVISKNGKRAALGTGFSYPTGVAVGGKGIVYIADTRHGRLVKFSY